MAEPTIPPGYEQTPGGLFVPVDIHAASASGVANPAAWFSDWALGGRTSAGVPVTQHTALGLAAYYACIRNISEDVAKLPLPVLQEVEGRRQKLRTHRLWHILNLEGNADMTAFVVRRTLQGHVLGWGDAFGLIVRDTSMTPGMDGEPIGVFPLHPSTVRVLRDPDTEGVAYEVRQWDMPMQMVQARDMIHLQGLSQDGFRGLSVLQIAAQSMGLSIAAQDYGASFFGNASTPGGQLRAPVALTDLSRQHLLDNMEKYRGAAASGKFLLLEGGITYEPISIPPDQAQYLSTRTFQVREVARWFRMPLTKLADLEYAHYANMEQENTAYATDTLGGWLTLWEQEIQRKLLPRGSTIYVRHNVNALMRGDSASRAAYYRTMVTNGIFSPNVVLEFEDMDGYEGGDEHFMQLNMATVPDIVSGAARRAPERQETPVMDETGESNESDAVDAVRGRNGFHHATN